MGWACGHGQSGQRGTGKAVTGTSYFRLIFALRQAARSLYPPGPVSIPPETPAQQTLLVVDDQSQLLRLLVRVFEKHGSRVLSAESVPEADEVLAAHAQEIDALVLDVIIPPAGVDPLLSRMGSLRDDVGVVLTSGEELGSALRQRLESLGGVFLRKPFAPAAVVDAVRTAIDGRTRAPARS
jgi:two-component system cell cycle sensor histidine kinase/response regulator CckA